METMGTSPSDDNCVARVSIDAMHPDDFVEIWPEAKVLKITEKRMA